MTAQEFVANITRVVYESAVSATVSLLKKPPGRRPSHNLILASEWYAGLSDPDKEKVQIVARIAAHQATFGMLAVLDGVRQIDASNHGKLELRHIHDGETVLLNSEDSEYLHELFDQCHSPI